MQTVDWGKQHLKNFLSVFHSIINIEAFTDIMVLKNWQSGKHSRPYYYYYILLKYDHLATLSALVVGPFDVVRCTYLLLYSLHFVGLLCAIPFRVVVGYSTHH